MKPRIVLPRRAERRASYLYGPPFPSEAGWVWADRRAQLERRSRHTGIERRVRQREEELFRTLFEVAPDAAVVLDGRGAVVVANRQCERLLGYRREELLGESVEMLLPERWRSVFLRQREQYAAQPRSLRLEPEMRRRDGSELPVEISLSPIETTQRQLVVAVIRDDSARRQAVAALEAELAEQRQAGAELRAANADLQRFGLAAAHRLQQFGAYLGRIEKRCHGVLDRETRRFLAGAAEAGNYMHRLVDDAVAYSRLHRPPQWPPEPVDSNAALRAALAELEPVLSESGGKVTQAALPPVFAEPAQLQLLFRHLLGNALEFAGRGHARIHVSAADGGGRWVFCVRDNGSGIAPAQRERLFQPFRRLPSQAGSGLGLALCKRIVERHGGSLWVESEAGRGTAFHFSLPKQPAPQGSRG